MSTRLLPSMTRYTFGPASRCDVEALAANDRLSPDHVRKSVALAKVVAPSQMDRGNCQKLGLQCPPTLLGQRHPVNQNPLKHSSIDFKRRGVCH